MGEYEELVREKIKERFGSVPKMAEATGLAPTTIYHALDRGIENTRTETSKKILYAVFGYGKSQVTYDFVPIAMQSDKSKQENELLAFFRMMSDEGRERLIEQARFLAERHPAR